MSHRVRRSALLLMFVTLGCGKGGDAKKPDVVAPPAAAVKERPTDAKPSGPPVVFASSDLLKVLDVGALPTIKGAEPTEQNAVLYDAEAPGALDEVLNFYVKQLTARQWKQFEPEGSRPVNEEYGSVQFKKDGHVVGVVVSKSIPKRTKARTKVTVRYFGNLDTETLPRPAGSVMSAKGQILSAHFSENSVADETAAIAKLLKADGWDEYDRFSPRQQPTADFASLLMRKRGYTLGVFVAKSPLPGKKTTVTYAIEALAHELPAPPEATKVEYDDAAWKLRAETPGDWKTAAEFYEKAMPAAGYKRMDGEKPQTTYYNLRFCTAAGDIVMVQVSSKDGKSTKILMDGLPAAVVTAIGKQMAPPPPKALAVNDLPLPGAAKNVKYDAAKEEITFDSAAEVVTLVAQLRARLTAAGWQEETSAAVVDRGAGMLLFRLPPATLRVTLTNLGPGRGTQATIAANGFVWPAE